MPIVEYRLIEGQHSSDEISSLLRASCVLFAEVLDTPVERIRAFADEVSPTHAAIGGELVNASGATAPFFHVYLLAGRPKEHRHRLLAGFTDLLVKHLHVDRSTVRGCVIQVDPEDWAIAGVPAAKVRRAEVAARAAQG